MSKATTAAMEALHGALALALANKIASGEATAADLAVARQFLKDNGIDAVPTDSNGLGKLAAQLPFATDDPEE
ncbi:hypothetical protein [Rhodopseudomonas palustris]|uniref:hypothetical protein n=1 Tax=Rhodopseudomonas palustris TaxID=1076 RepID=UPI0021F39763|nr:hypothetical protein [Rhodopseudomonas palustris]UYO52490.1 hypothetical protein KQX61_18100 [Rhodopseudomonas palustris]